MELLILKSPLFFFFFFFAAEWETTHQWYVLRPQRWEKALGSSRRPHRNIIGERAYLIIFLRWVFFFFFFFTSGWSQPTCCDWGWPWTSDPSPSPLKYQDRVGATILCFGSAEFGTQGSMIGKHSITWATSLACKRGRPFLRMRLIENLWSLLRSEDSIIGFELWSLSFAPSRLPSWQRLSVFRGKLMPLTRFPGPCLCCSYLGRREQAQLLCRFTASRDI